MSETTASPEPRRSAPEPRRWYSLASVLPILAEASPDEFLAAVERDVIGDATVQAALFEEEMR